MLFFDATTIKSTFTTANQKRWTLTTCYEITKRTYDFVMTYVGNRTINMTLYNDAVSKLYVFRKYIEIQNKSHMTSLQLVKEI